MEHYNIRIFNKAQEDLIEIVNYINQFYTDTALKYYDDIVNTIGTLSYMPERCPFVKDDILRLKEYRWIEVKNYIVFFIIKGETVEIRRILYHKRQYKDLI